MAQCNKAMRQFVALCLLLAPAVFADDLLVQTKHGQLHGKLMTIKSGREIRGFLGVRYAEPPIADLRFQAPVEVKSWDGVRQATEVHAICPQINTYAGATDIEGDEDCLFLNVYAPKTSEMKGPLPVMMWLHGGGFFFGSGNTMFYGPDYMLTHDIVLVSINYRLGALGFLSTGDMVVPGNMGLKDQNMALRWIHQNIQSFGGDPNSVTVFGESAGGASAHYHVISPLSKSLIHGAISQSGTALAPWASMTRREGYELGRELSKHLGCTTESSQKMLECLKRVKPEDLVQAHVDLLRWDIDPLALFGPVVEPDHAGAFLTKTPKRVIKSRKANLVPWVVGFNKDDGAIRTAGLFGRNLLQELDRDFEQIAHVMLFQEGRLSSIGEFSRKIREFYFKDAKIDEKQMQPLTDLFSEAGFSAPAEKAVTLHRQYLKQPIYYYLFSYRGVASFTEIFGDKSRDYGVCHADELQYLFPMGDSLFPDKPPTEQDRRVTKLMTKMWTNFAKYRNPTPENWSLAKWERVQSEENEFLDIVDEVSLRMDKKVFSERISFWNNLVDNLTLRDIRDEL